MKEGVVLIAYTLLADYRLFAKYMERTMQKQSNRL